jgi:membrane associated rhomboid family serine protease
VLIPWNTDAPIYHAPWATGGLILINTVVWIVVVASGATVEDVEPWILAYGDGLHPLQWLTSNFLHAGFVHLLGNMVFLWAFGLVVEGKLGWWRFTVVYLGMGIVQCAFEQICMLGADGGGSLGASGIIYGLLAMALVWAPRNELSCILILGFRPVSFEISILMLAMIYIGIEIGTTALEGFGWGSSVLHLVGTALGFGVGTWLLKSDRVDCEGWDLYAVFAGREGEKVKTRRKKKKPKTKAELQAANQRMEANRVVALAEIQRMLVAGNVRGAVALNAKMSKSDKEWQLPEPDSRQLIMKMLEAQAWSESVALMVSHLRRFPDAVRVRLKLAQVLVQNEHRPAQALRVLEKLPASLPAALKPAREKLLAEATRLREQAPAELACEDW